MPVAVFLKQRIKQTKESLMKLIISVEEISWNTKKWLKMVSAASKSLRQKP